MDLLFAGLGDDSVTDPYDSLSNLCTMLLVSEEGLVPLEPVTDLVVTALRKSPRDGDVQVMAARALALLLDKFTPSFSVFVNRKGRSSVTEGFKTIFSLVSDPTNTAKRTFAKTAPSELTEELLKCLTLGSTSTPAVRAVMPATEVLLRFCRASLDGSKWTSCKVLRLCALLARCGMLTTSAQQLLVKGMLYEHLESLAALDVDFEWDELLRAVTEGIVTMRVWCSGGEDKEEGASVTKTSAKPKQQLAKPARRRMTAEKPVKRSREDDVHVSRREAGVRADRSTPSPTTASSSARRRTSEEHFASLCVRICGNDGIAETRKELVLACANAVVHARDVAMTIPVTVRCRVLEVLRDLLRATSQTTFGLSNPFTRKDKAASEMDDEDGFKPLPNLQWEVPPLQWSALVLLSKLLGAEPEAEKEYIWGWRGEGDLWYWYRSKERAVLTAAFFERQEEVPLKRGEHQANLLSMTDHHRPTNMVARIHFQPVPYRSRIDSSSTPFTRVYAAEKLLTEYEKLMPGVRQILRALSFGTTAPARLAKMVSLHVVCHTPPNNSEEARAALRHLVAECPTHTLEKLAEQLVRRDSGWAPVLCDAGIADAIAQGTTATTATAALPDGGHDDAPSGAIPAAAKRTRLEGTLVPTRAARGREDRVAHDGARSSPRKGESPIVKLLRGVSAAQHKRSDSHHPASGATTPQLGPEGFHLPHPTSTTQGFTEQLRTASFPDTLSLLESAMTTTTTTTAQRAGGGGGAAAEHFDIGSMKEVEGWLEEDVASRQRIASAFIALILRELQAISIQGKSRVLVDAVADDVLMNIVVCDPRESGEPAAQPQCPQGHRLLVHFSTNWRCDKCGQHTGYGSLACRECNYDLCHECMEKASNSLEVNPTATVADVARVWLARHKPGTTPGHSSPAKHTKAPPRNKENLSKRAAPSPSTEDLYNLFTEDSLIPFSAPSKLLFRLQEGGAHIHCGPALSPCVCGAVQCPTEYLATHTDRVAPLTSSSPVTGVPSRPLFLAGLLSAVAPLVAADAGVVHALVEAVESHGSTIFLDGLSGLPVLLQLCLSSLAPCLPLSLKVDLTRFFAIDCRRYALYHLQESGIFLRGSVQGEIGNNGLSHKVVVVRGDAEETGRRLHRTFAALPSLRNKMEFSFEEEEGTGNGPTQELYTELSHTYRARRDMWYHSDDSGVVGFPSCKGLYWRDFFVLGAACARALVDGYAMELDVLPCVWPLLLPSSRQVERHRDSATECVVPDAKVLLSTLRELDPAFVRSLEMLLTSSDAELEAMGLVDHKDEPLTQASVASYVDARVREHLEMGLVNLQAMRLGLLTSLDLGSVCLLSPVELSTVLCGRALPGTAMQTRGLENGEGKPRLFTAKDLRAVVVAAHGYSADSKEVDMFVSIVGDSWDAELQSCFLEFLTGSARLPLNGLAGLGRRITVVKKDMEDRSHKEQTLPSCNTCFLYFKLPPYTTRDTMQARLTVAVTEGRKNFSLS